MKNQPELEMLRQVKTWPHKLFYRGEWKADLFSKCAAVVGSRRMTSYGEKVIEILIPRLVEEGWTIVSGFMYGVDMAAHRAAVENGGRTIAVLGWGINNKSTRYRDEQMEQRIIQTGGLIISEWEEQLGALWTFPQRNRIVAGISRELYVVEAAERSGALITAELAYKLGRTIWAVPGPVTSGVSVGTNRWIEEGKARPWSPVNKDFKTDTVCTKEEAEVCTVLQNDILGLDELVRKMGKDPGRLGGLLTQMELKGLVEERGGKFWVKK